MKKMKRLAALFLAVVMVMAMGMTAFAVEGEETGESATPETSKIIINSPAEVPGEDGETKIPATYTAYKIFDVDSKTIKVKDENGKEVDKEIASYTRPRDKALEETDKLKALFDIVDNGGKEIYYNAKSDIGSKASDLEAYLKLIVPDGALKTYSTVNGSNEIDGVEPGYYYVQSNAGNAAMLRAVAGKETEITEKNTESGWGDGGKKSYREEIDVNDADEDGDREDTILVEDAFYAIGETVNYVITYDNAQNFDTVTNGNVTTTTKNYQFVVNDEMPAHVTIDTNSVVITVTENGGTEENGGVHVLHKPVNDEEIGKTGTYTGGVSTNGFDIVIPWAATDNPAILEDFYYKNTPAEIKIEYSAKVTGEVDAGTALTNTVKIAPNAITDTTEEKRNDIYTGALRVKKFDDTAEGATFENSTKLAGAEFVVIDTEVTAGAEVPATAKYLTYTEANGYSWVEKDENTKLEALKKIGLVVLTTDKDGLSNVVKGLNEDDYYLLETVAPAGYNLLDKTIKVTISTLTKEEIAELQEIVNLGNAAGATEEQIAAATAAAKAIEEALVKSPEIGNKTGVVLPSTGGIGTTIFYVVGGILVLGAAVLLITKKRMSARN